MSGPLVAVTGATGFLGRHLVAALTEAGASLRILARRSPPFGPEIAVVEGDLEQPRALERLVAGADAVVHLAGLTGAPDRAAFFATNRDGTRAVALAAHAHAPAARFILVSSLAARAPHLSAYAASKRAGEDAVAQAFAAAAGQLIIVRPPAVYGPGDRQTLALFQAASFGLVPYFGPQRIALLHVADAAAALARLALGAGEPGCYALSDPNPAGYTMAEILTEAARATGRRIRLVRLPGVVLRAAGLTASGLGRLGGRAPVFSAGKAREMLHPDWSVAPGTLPPAAIWRPRIAIAEGFRDTVAWYREAGWLKPR